jgi:predicted alpha/beta superfamily hydrolase
MLLLGVAALALTLAGCTTLDPPVESVPVTFQVTVPASTPADSQVWISGNHEALGTWNGRGLQLTKQSDGTYAATANFPPATMLQWKVTRGSWDTVEMGPGFENVENHNFTVTLHQNIARATVARWRGPTTSGNIKYHAAFPSAFLKSRDVVVYLPPGYDANPTRRYPVLYMHDGQNLFDRLTSAFGSEWGADETAERLIAAGEMEPIIIVGPYNTSDRIAEYTQVADPRYGGGDADKYGRFLKEELKPFIDQTYRTKPEREFTGVAGSSLGGLVSMYFGLTLNDTFSRIGSISPSIWWSNREILTRVNNLSAKPPIKVWVDIGTNEGSTPQEEVTNTRDLRNALVAKGFTLNQDLKYLEVQGAGHDETAWNARMDQIFKFLYPPVAAQ